jgi:N-acetylglucosamine kinase-like BadF-type ATPase
MHILLVEGGKTKTLASIIDEEGNVYGFFIGPSTGWTTVGLETALKNLSLTVTKAFERSGLRKKAELAIIGLPDLDTERTLSLIENFLDRNFVWASERIIIPDYVVAYYAITLGAPGVAVIAGTGSIAYGRNSRNEDARAGGWGWLVDDEGSALWIAIKSIEAAVRAWDGRGPPTILTEKLAKHFALSTPKDLIEILYSFAGKDLSILAQVSKLVDVAAEEGDEIAKNILIQGGQELALMVKAVYTKILTQEKDIVVGGVGSVFLSRILRESFSKHVKKHVPGSTLVDPLVRYAPIKGLVAILRERLNLSSTIIEKVTRYFSQAEF